MNNREKLKFNIMDSINMLKKQITEFELQLKKLEEEEKPQEKLHAEIVSDHIFFKYKGFCLGSISDEGHCEILNDDDYIEAYKIWRADGMPIDTESIIEWRGGKYGFDEYFNFKRTDIERGTIYDFDYCYYQGDCEDDNIKRFPHNNRPIGY